MPRPVLPHQGIPSMLSKAEVLKLSYTENCLAARIQNIPGLLIENPSNDLRIPGWVWCHWSILWEAHADVC